MKLHRFISVTLRSLLVVSFMLSSSAHALSSDRDQPADIEADEVEFDLKKGTRLFVGNVIVIQGTLRLKADRLLGVYKNGTLETATAWGSLARFKQRPDGKQHDVEGWAKKIVVNETQNTLTLIGKASLKQNQDIARGQTIVYNMATDTLKVKGGAKMKGAGKDGSTTPERKLEDPFKDGNQGPPARKIQQKKKKKKSKKATKDDKDLAESNDEGEGSAESDENSEVASEAEEEQEEAVQQLEPVKAGRSRLILQPK